MSHITDCFNTGNWYTAHGQRIGIVQLGRGDLVFYDLDRMIDGFIPAEFFPHENRECRVREAYLNSGWEYYNLPTSMPFDEYHRYTQLAQEAAREAPSLKRD